MREYETDPAEYDNIDTEELDLVEVFIDDAMEQGEHDDHGDEEIELIDGEESWEDNPTDESVEG